MMVAGELPCVDVLVFGPTPGVKAFLKAIDPARVRVVGVVAPDGDDDTGLPPLSPGAIHADDTLGRLPIVAVGDDPLDAVDAGYEALKPMRFLGDRNQLMIGHGLSNRVLHPVALSERMRVDLSGMAMTLGLPGSGNVLCGRILQAIQALRGIDPLGAPPGSAVHYLLTAVAGYRQLVMERLWALFQPLGATLIDGGTSYRRSAHFRHVEQIVVLAGRRVLCILNMPDPWHLTGAVRGTHALVYPDELQTLRAAGVATIFCMRHPLDALVSMARKWDGSPRSPAWLLENPDWVDFCADYMARHMEHTRRVADDAWVLRYEDLLSMPPPTIERLAAALGTTLTASEAERIWEALAFRPLLAAKEHFQGGGSGR